MVEAFTNFHLGSTAFICLRVYGNDFSLGEFNCCQTSLII